MVLILSPFVLLAPLSVQRPQAFGLVASLTVFTGFAAIFTDLGLSAALIHKPIVTETDRSTAFWINALSGAILFLLIGLGGHLIAIFYRTPQLAQVAWWMGLNFLLSVGVVQLAALERGLHFRRNQHVILFEQTGQVRIAAHPVKEVGAHGNQDLRPPIFDR